MKHIPVNTFTRLDEMIATQRAFYRNPAMALAITDDQDLLHNPVYGLANVENNTPVGPQTLFQIGSIGKVFTAIALLQARQDGLIDLHAPVTRYLPWFALRSSFESISLHHLMTHSAGIVMGMDAHADARGEVYLLRETEAANPPGLRFHYSNVGYKVLGLVLEAVYQLPYEAIISQGILDPLGMADSTAVITHHERERMARGLVPRFDDRPYHRSQPLEPAPWVETNTGDGCISSTGSDMARFMRMLLNQGQGVLDPESFRLLVQPWIKAGENESYGYGLYTIERAGRRYLGHGGDMPGFVAGLYLDLENKTGVTVLMATPYVPGLSMHLLDAVRAAGSGQPLPPRLRVPDPLRVENAGEYAGRYRRRSRVACISRPKAAPSTCCTRTSASPWSASQRTAFLARTRPANGRSSIFRATRSG